eukprot:15337877-Ditylum_brightwellii.AAC.1
MCVTDFCCKPLEVWDAVRSVYNVDGELMIAEVQMMQLTFSPLSGNLLQMLSDVIFFIGPTVLGVL